MVVTTLSLKRTSAAMVRMAVDPHTNSVSSVNIWFNLTKSVLVIQNRDFLSIGALARILGKAGGSVVWSSSGRME